jgi:hypothetical protein
LIPNKQRVGKFIDFKQKGLEINERWINWVKFEKIGRLVY